ncbi:interleukin-10 receptor subunit beta-like isoform X4 [Anguilla anguilla]|uniref:interleukin-10 receptor subunit beta-like isoform X4 n=1 Tax=Anguilla anguilla TaxID=7936 RepID=UPI0015B028A8|nr:interleukin-10 receptor subunit beta-like isoform X4 [Anguilla anguilla]
MAYTFLPETCFLVILSVSVVLANLPVPKNVRVISINMGVILEWDRPNTSLGNLTYTAEYRSSDDAGFSTVCRNQTERRCDFTQGIHPFGIYVFQVRAERRGETSRWAKTKEFLPDQETVIGGPTVRLVSREGNLEMDIQDPVMKVKDLIEIYSTVGYNIRYWKEGEEDKATVMNDRQQNSLVLIQLEALSREGAGLVDRSHLGGQLCGCVCGFAIAVPGRLVLLQRPENPLSHCHPARSLKKVLDGATPPIYLHGHAEQLPAGRTVPGGQHNIREPPCGGRTTLQPLRQRHDRGWGSTSTK